MYACQAQNNEGMTEVKVEVTVQNQGTPVASVAVELITAVQGHTVTMECHATGMIRVYLGPKRKNNQYYCPTCVYPSSQHCQTPNCLLPFFLFSFSSLPVRPSLLLTHMFFSLDLSIARTVNHGKKYSSFLFFSFLFFFLLKNII